ncbi:MAG: formylglycine-generating enzyme family protein [Geobacteraceae bacterium]|nr:formylglycine-generating enzyme family protein [Geobacteraceae bacterium]
MERADSVVNHSRIILLAILISMTSLPMRATGQDLFQRNETDAVQNTIKSQTYSISSPRSEFKDSVTGMEFVPVAGDCFMMGDVFGDGQGDEKPAHEVCLDGFYMGKFEVTNAQYRMFRPDHNSGMYEGNTLNLDNQPVANISWYEAVEYAAWLSKRSGRVYQLPTEAQWEYAARGKTSGRNFWDSDPGGACRYANGADLTAKSQWSAWTTTNCDDGFKVAAPVGSFRANAFGLHDMMGNAWEWTNDWYDAEYYYKSPSVNPRGPMKGSLRIPRGGGWGNASECVRVSDRNGFDPDFRILFLGFRLVSPMN